MVTDADLVAVTQLLGRQPSGDFEVVVRDATGTPVVIRNAPFLHDGTPMPTRFWLLTGDVHRRIGQLESSGGVRAAEAEVDPVALAEAHRRYDAERTAEIPTDYDGPRPSGGIGGTRHGHGGRLRLRARGHGFEHRGLAARDEERADARVVLAVRQLLDHRLVQLLHQRPHGLLWRARIVFLLLGREDRPLVEQMRVQAGVTLARVLGLNVKHATAVTEVVVVAQDGALANALGHGRGQRELYRRTTEIP